MEWEYRLEEIRSVAEEWWIKTQGFVVFAFHGQMGAGKTTFIHSLCDVKGVSGVVGSPTFALVNEYAYREQGVEKEIFHIDLYRVKSEEEAILAGIEEYIYSGSVCFVEWPEKAPGIFPESTVHVHLEVTTGGLRRLILQYPDGNL
jgi:tRNA threonylcarbamoyladenosine biosynthesis protein TsaE